MLSIVNAARSWRGFFLGRGGCRSPLTGSSYVELFEQLPALSPIHRSKAEELSPSGAPREVE
jgi:hypothetical protein